MAKQLAIKGHRTRGNEVIKLLEMMGGHNGSNLLGNKSDYAYFITDSGDIGCSDILTTFQLITLLSKSFWRNSHSKSATQFVWKDSVLL